MIIELACHGDGSTRQCCYGVVVYETGDVKHKAQTQSLVGVFDTEGLDTETSARWSGLGRRILGYFWPQIVQRGNSCGGGPRAFLIGHTLALAGHGGASTSQLELFSPPNLHISLNLSLLSPRASLLILHHAPSLTARQPQHLPLSFSFPCASFVDLIFASPRPFSE